MIALMKNVNLKNYYNQSMSVSKFIDYRKPYKNLASKISLDMFYEYFKNNVFLVVESNEQNNEQSGVYKIYKDIMRDKAIFGEYLNLLKKLDIKSAFEQYFSWLFDRNKFLIIFNQIKKEDLVRSQGFKTLYSGFLVGTINVIDQFTKGYYFIKISKFDTIFPYLTPKVVGVVLDEHKYITRDFKNTMYKFKKIYDVFNDIDSIKSIYIDINSNKYYFENFTSKNTRTRMHGFKERHSFLRFEYTQDQTLNENTYYYEFNDIFSHEATKYSSVYFSIIIDNIKKHKDCKHAFLLPKIDLKTKYIVSNLLNRIDETSNLVLFFRGIQVIDDYYKDKDQLELITEKPSFFKNMYLIIDTDELHLHIIQLKKSHNITEVILDSDTVILDGFDRNTFEFVNSKKYKKEFIDVYREYHQRMMKIKVHHKVYSVHNEHPEIFRIFKASRFNNFIFYNKFLFDNEKKIKN